MSDLDPGARALIDAVRETDVPVRGAKERVKRRVLARVAAVALAASGTTASTTTAASVGVTTAGGAVTAKAALVGLAVSALVAGGIATKVALSRGHARPATTATSSVSSASVAASSHPPVAAAERVAAGPTASDDPAPPAEVAPVPRARAASPRAVSSAQPSAIASSDATRPPRTPETLEQELPLLASAQAALRSGDTDRALVLLAEHAKRFPEGALAEERRAVHALAMCRKGLGPAAVAEGAAFVRDAPASPLAERVRESCGLR
jgi:hypothetical protein